MDKVIWLGGSEDFPGAVSDLVCPAKPSVRGNPVVSDKEKELNGLLN